MEIKRENKPHSQVSLAVALSAAEMDQYEQEVLAGLRGEIAIPGFRKGKASLEAVKKQVDEAKMKQLVIEKAIPDTYVKALVQEKINPLGEPQIDLKKIDPLEYEAIVTVFPELKLGDYKKIKVKKEKITVGKEDVDAALGSIRRRLAKEKEFNGPVQNDHKVEIDFKGYMDGAEIKGATSQNHPLVLGSKMMVPGFEDQIVGLKVGDKKEFDLTFPDDYHKEDLRSKKVHFEVELKKAFEIELPELNDQLAQQATGEKISLKDFRQKIEENITKAREEEAEYKTQSRAVEQLANMLEADIPDILINEEVDRLIFSIRQQVAADGLTWEQYLEHSGNKEEQLREQLRGDAEKRVRGELALAELAKQEKIEASDSEVDTEIKKLLARAPKGQEKRAKDYYAAENNRLRIAASLRLRKAVERLGEIAGQ